MKIKLIIIPFASFIVLFVLCAIYGCSSDNCKDTIQNLEKELGKEQKVDNIPLTVYVENSGSIDGYVANMANFRTDIYALISSSCVNSNKLSLNYINDEIFPQDNEPRAFILNLTPSRFKNAGGQRASSDIAKVISLCMGKNKNQNMLLASDFIFSPGPGVPNVEEYLKIQKTDIKNTIEKSLGNDNSMAIVIYKGLSKFSGTFFNKDDARTYINNEDRPFYVMLAGKKSHIALLMSKTKESTHFINTYSEFLPVAVNYEILKDGKVGNFRMCKNSHVHIEKLTSERRGNGFEFCIGVDYSTLPLEDSYLLAKENYEVSDRNYSVKSVARNADKNTPWTHILTITSNSERLSSADMDIKLKKVWPKWISESNDNEGMTPVAGKTFGIKTLLEGIDQAYKEKSKTDFYTKLHVILEN